MIDTIEDRSDDLPSQSVTLIEMTPCDDRRWRTEELGALFRHQLSAPLQVDLHGAERGRPGKGESPSESQGLVLKSVGDLLAHPDPPVELLKITKDFAKACRLSPHSHIPHEVASVLYFGSIAASMVRCHRRITGLTDAALEEGLRWVLSRNWLDAPTRALIEASLKLLNAEGGGSR